mgnify:CR=1 FL=1
MVLAKRLVTIFLVTVGLLWLYRYVTSRVDIPALRTDSRGVGMEPVVQGSQLLWRLKRGERDREHLHRSDIVAYKAVDHPNEFFVGRIIGLEGERVALVRNPETKAYAVFIDGKPLDESAYNPKSFADDYPETHVPRGHLFILADIRQNEESRQIFAFRDSRTLGFIPYEKVLGKLPVK